MSFWDSSALVPLLTTEARTAEVDALAAEDRKMQVWWGAEVECMSAIVRAERMGASAETTTYAIQRLQLLISKWDEVAPSANLREAAKRLVRSHVLRAGDALQLAAVLILADGDPSSVEVISLDDRLRDAAMREGFVVLPKRRR